MKVIVFDFDGVLINSAEEHYLVAVRAFRDLGNEIRETKRFRKNFYFLRPYIKKAEDFYAVLIILTGKKKFDASRIPEQREQILASRKKEAENFVRHYYNNRRKLLKKSFRSWMKLQHTNNKIITVMKKLSQKYPVYIATARDKRTSLKMLKSFSAKIPRTSIFSREETPNKAGQMKMISKASGAGFKDIIFIEDNFENLIEAAKTGITPVLVDWGYSTARQRKAARERGFTVVSRKSFEKQMKKLLS